MYGIQDYLVWFIRVPYLTSFSGVFPVGLEGVVKRFWTNQFDLKNDLALPGVTFPGGRNERA